ncbi:hypothetical protein APUTEX25_002266 [Auxenochlorella protothecoides]|uniref:Kinesin-like protein n=1 Tax=Auxenochlorella protothecoides TaxID=3075 RepID=A0A3M7L4L7_AUXPR|nr:hypothetical protein APUTEX25_002266 [Auxenochlorella protothecoides]|eukprot:RMZ57034.1 hypothetical protein APUTEX25_002266 [Auxenochlorella protothecoides]
MNPSFGTELTGLSLAQTSASAGPTSSSEHGLSRSNESGPLSARTTYSDDDGAVKVTSGDVLAQGTSIGTTCSAVHEGVNVVFPHTQCAPPTLYNSYRFTFDTVYGPSSSQEEVYAQCARPAVLNVLQGYNASIIAYGQTGTGKTFTMEGEEGSDRSGIIPRAIQDVFSSIARDTGERCRFLVRASYLQIYNEVISDLLKPGPGNLGVREDRRRGVHVEGLSEWVVRSPGEVFMLMRKGAAGRTTGATKLNEASSRSHAIFMLTVEKAVLLDDGPGGASAAGLAAAMELAGVPGTGPALRQTVRVGKLNLVDLAGSERVHVTGATGQRLEESKKINQSLSTLGNVISALAGGARAGREGKPHVPYRDSKLTRILEDSLGGNCKTTFLAMISPAVEAYSESLSTLKFANRAKNVRNAPTVNEDLDHRTLLRKYELELRRLRAELQQKSKDLVDKRLLLELDAARRREQADKLAAISALERQSAEIMRHKAAMAALQGRISLMQSQLLVGGHRVEDTPQFRQLLAAEQDRIRGQYQARLAELEAEREVMAEGHAQVERYRVLLCKQRDIMTALTQRLGERDGQVLALQGKLDAALARQRELEDGLDARTAEMLGMRRAATEAAADAATQGGPAEEGETEEGATEGLDGAASGGGAPQGSAADAALEHTSLWRIPAVRIGAGHEERQPGPMLLGPHTDTSSEAGSSVNGRGASSQGDAGPDGDGRTSDTASQSPAPDPAPSARRAEVLASPAAGIPGTDSPAARPASATKLPPDTPTLLQTKLEALRRERSALRSILQEKVAVVVADAERSLRSGGLNAEAPQDAVKKLSQQLAYVQNLVGATISAMAPSE